MPSFLTTPTLRLLCFVGKGGVGKTTCAVGAAWARAERGERVRLVSTDPAHSVEDRIGERARPSGLSVEEVDAEAEIEVFRHEHRDTLHTIVDRGTMLDEDDVTALLDRALPGMDELTAFLRLSEIAAEDEHDLTVVDTAPTGHTLRLLDTPKQFGRWLDFLDVLLEKHRTMRSVFGGHTRPDALDRFVDDLRTRTRRTADLLGDPARCRIVPVTQAEPVIRAETNALLHALSERDLPVHEVLVNRLPPEGAPRGDLPDVSDGGELWGIPEKGDAFHEAAPSALWEGAKRLEPGEGRTRPAGELPSVVAPISCPEARLVLVAGKGGVGKTTMAAALAARRGATGERVLVLSTDPAHSLGTVLQADLTDAPAPVAEGVDAMEVDAAGRFADLRGQYAGEVRQFFDRAGGRSVDVPFERAVMENLMDLAPPGVDEIMGWTAAVDALNDDRYDACILDAAPTGHFVRLLEMPSLFEEWLRTFFRILQKYKTILRLPELSDRLVRLSRQTKAVRRMLHGEGGAMLAVTVPEPMVRAETRDLLAAARRRDVRVAGGVVNRLPPEHGGAVLAAEREALSGVALAGVTTGRPPTGPDALAHLGLTLFS